MVADMKAVFNGLITTLNTLWKDSLNLRICQQKLAKLKGKD